MSLQSSEFQPEQRGPLHGVRVLDLSHLMAGNMLTLQLADFGAEVIKVEPPDVGDTLRHWSSPHSCLVLPHSDTYMIASDIEWLTKKS